MVSMFALTIDQRASRVDTDRVPELLDRLASVDAVLPFERTVGDEVQGLVREPEAVVAAVEQAFRARHWSVGLGIGPVELPLPRSVREARGPALLRARSALEAAKKVPSVRIAVAADDTDERAAEVQSLLRLVGSVVQRRTDAQWRVINAVRQAGDRGAAAERLGITVQSISKGLLAAGESVVADVYPLLARLLAELDERSE